MINSSKRLLNVFTKISSNSGYLRSSSSTLIRTKHSSSSSSSSSSTSLFNKFKQQTIENQQQQQQRTIFYSSYITNTTNYKPIKNDEIFSEILESKRYEEYGNYEASRSILVRAKDMVEKTLGMKHPITINVLFRLINAEMAIGGLDAAQKHCQTILDRINVNEDIEYSIPSIYNLILCHQYKGDLEQAAKVSDLLVEIATKRNDWELCVGSILNKAIILSLGCRDVESKEIFDQCIALLHDKLDAKNHLNESVYGNFASFLHSIEIDKEAEAYYMMAEQSAKDNNNDKELVNILTNYTEFLYDSGQFDECETMLKEASAKAEQVYGRESPKVASIIFIMARLYRAKENPTWAEGFFNKCISIFEHYRSQSKHQSMLTKKENEAVPSFEPGKREIELRTNKEVDIEYGNVLWEYAQMLREKGRQHEAMNIEERARRLNSIDD
ncbi:hypothetical protein DFA_11639 [Cavenderia fasciculata]|uniref:Tetratricopeptide-like helical domain-containing protein n=1 Tax=Cavenderia fasciculata TaxID=261658 RepID=F4QDT1_CACFS|nr:uncharacterized protein DFA_11639 [Cavenderia fasciculata]EGG13878.1 hypothetical protein DFA_11639 [Cavenderia fasciculata]|eukprot:XP_004350586.1 hypothetical protein DFA_11639 [Cavenderia fasciculata]